MDGVHYHFLTREEFIQRRDAGFFAEWADVYGNFYGTPRQALVDMLDAGSDVLFDIDVQGAAQLRESMGVGCHVFLFPPTLAALRQRLLGRGTDEDGVIARRLATAPEEIAQAPHFDHWIVNDDLEKAYDALRAVYVAESTRPAYHPALLGEGHGRGGTARMAELVVALDFPTRDEALDMARRLAGVVTWVKVGLELYTAEGPSMVAELRAMGFKVFVDLKFMDIPNTVRGAVRSAVKAGADMVNVHATGGARMMAAAREGLDEAAAATGVHARAPGRDRVDQHGRTRPGLAPGRHCGRPGALAGAFGARGGARRRGLLGPRGGGGQGGLRRGLLLPDPGHPHGRRRRRPAPGHDARACRGPGRGLPGGGPPHHPGAGPCNRGETVYCKNGQNGCIRKP